MLRRTFLATVAVLALAASADAASMYVYMVLDPAGTAGAGVATVPSGGAQLGVSSNRSGAGTFHLYAVDDVAGSSGIRNYSVTLAGTTSITHRSPVGQYDNDAAFGNGSGPFSVGFGDLRSGANISPIVAGQGVSNAPQIGGFGQTASNFGEKAGAANALSYSGVTSGQWGVYGDPLTSGLVQNGAGFSNTQKSAILLAEGQYAIGTPPTVSAASIAYWTNAGLTSSAFAPSYLLNTNPFVSVPEPATLSLIGLAVVGFCGLGGRRRS
jgi:hypothetical protein